MTRFRQLAILWALTFLTSPLWSFETFDKLAEKIRTIPVDVPHETSIVFFTTDDGKIRRAELTIQRAVRTDGSFVADIKTEEVFSHQEFARDGFLIVSRQDDVKKGLSSTVEVNSTRTSARYVIKEKGADKSDKSIQIDRSVAFFPELSYLVPRIWQLGVRDGMSFKTPSPDGGMMGDFEIKLAETSNPLKFSDKYSYPTEFKAAFNTGSYVVADLYLTGVGAMFYPHHFFYVFKKTEKGLAFAGYWGQEPAKAIFEIVK